MTDKPIRRESVKPKSKYWLRFNAVQRVKNAEFNQEKSQNSGLLKSKGMGFNIYISTKEESKFA
eukprot:snap_masked-scaffold_25-processed-gene-5.31-mRNA-1 protein AED:1.00 eAED:1.00 QI:0/0/0/0/1/1/3/0/63